jgi:DNA helicase HerA-like ATPase
MSAGKTAGRIGVWGRSGSGKSSYVKALIRDRPRVVIFDPLDEYAAELRGFKRCASVEDVRRGMVAAWSGFRLAYVPPAGREADRLSALCELLRYAQEPYRAGKSRAGLTLVVEEMNASFPVHGGAERAPGFAELCSRGRHYGIELIGVAQRIAEVSTRFRGNATQTVVFPQSGPRDLAAAKDALGWVTQNQLRRLVPHRYLIADGSGEVKEGENRVK